MILVFTRIQFQSLGLGLCKKRDGRPSFFVPHCPNGAGFAMGIPFTLPSHHHDKSALNTFNNNSLTMQSITSASSLTTGSSLQPFCWKVPVHDMKPFIFSCLQCVDFCLQYVFFVFHHNRSSIMLMHFVSFYSLPTTHLLLL